MTSALATPALPAFDGRGRAVAGPGGGDRLTLAQRLDCVLESVGAVGTAECPICGAGMRPVVGGAAACGGCGAEVR